MEMAREIFGHHYLQQVIIRGINVLLKGFNYSDSGKQVCTSSRQNAINSNSYFIWEVINEPKSSYDD